VADQICSVLYLRIILFQQNPNLNLRKGNAAGGKPWRKTLFMLWCVCWCLFQVSNFFQ